jgi:hypothetical protein
VVEEIPSPDTGIVVDALQNAIVELRFHKSGEDGDI